MNRKRREVVLDEDRGGFLPAGHAMVLGMTAGGAPLDATLRAVAELLEAEIPDCSASIMLLDPAGMLRTGAAPSLPLGYLHLLAEGVPVGANVGSCGAAVHRLRPVVVEDIASAPSWEPYAAAALEHGLRACWSVPIVGEAQQPLGAFAMYYAEPRRPTAVQIQRLGGYAQLVAVAVQQDKGKRALSRTLGTDPVTGLASSSQLPDTIEEARSRCRFDEGEWVAVATVEAGRLRECNQALGYAAGDELVRAAASRVAAIVGNDGRLFRTGGSAFTLVRHGTAEEPPDRLPRRMLAALEAPFVVAGVTFTADPRAGMKVCRTGATSVDDLVGGALDALVAARADSTTRLLHDDASHRRGAPARLSNENDLRRALRDGELVVHYQPQFRLDSGAMVGVEALVRWDHPHRGMLAPEDFLPAVERGRLHAELSRLVLHTACRDAAGWRDQAPETPITVAVNLSAPELGDLRLPGMISDALAASGLPSGALCLEITEQTALLEAGQATTTLRDLKALGVKIAMDDFGTGYSALAHARRFPIDYLKIDRSFVRAVDSNPEDAAVVSAIVGLADGLGLDVIVEGVETRRHREVLLGLGCRTGQGYLWSRAVPAARIAALLYEPVADVLDSPARADDPTWRPDTDSVIASVVHEARTPLTVLRLHADLLGEGEAPPSPSETAGIIARQVDALDGIFAAASDARALDSGALALSRRTFELCAFVRTALRDAAPSMSVPLRFDDCRPATVTADPGRILQILTNLLSNATRYSPSGAHITVRLERTPTHAHLIVEDEGPGVAPDRVGYIFRKYGRADTAQPGLGLGLYISRQLARSHGGDLTYAHRHPRGARFQLTLPLHDAADG